MDLKIINKKYSALVYYITNGKVKEAGDILGEFAEYLDQDDFRVRLKSSLETYRNILKYSFGEIEDPEKDKVYYKLLRELLELGDHGRNEIITKNELLPVFIGNTKYIKALQRAGFISSSELQQMKAGEINNYILCHTGGFAGQLKTSKWEEAISRIFHILWMTDKYKDVEVGLVERIRKGNDYSWIDRCLVVSAITLSLFRQFDSTKVYLLFDFFKDNEHEVWQRALTGLVTALHKYDTRLFLYPGIINQLKILSEEKGIKKDIETIIIQLIKSLDTEKIARKIQDELVPEMLELRTRLDNKLDLENIISEKNIEDKNPEWENFFKDSPGLYDKFEEFSMLQMEGSDVFMSAFSMLKGFDFFRNTSNWFIPFYKENSTVKKSLENAPDEEVTGKFIKGIEHSSFLCNSDKYSFCFNIGRMPAQQKNMMAEVFNMEMKAMDEIRKDEELIDTSGESRKVFTQYLQDLYRFFKLHPDRSAFFDVFDMEFDFHNSNFFKLLIEDDSVARNMGEFYFEKQHYRQAIDIFSSLASNNKNPELLEKVGYSFQKLGKFREALDFYRKTELYDRNRAWVLKKIAFCYRKLKMYEKALEYYKQAEILEPDNLVIQSYKGHTLMDMKEYDEALKYYYKVEYLTPDNHKIQRPIAWCSFLSGKIDAAKNYFQKVIEKEGNEYDYMNLGHVHWCEGNVSQAIKNYKKSLDACKNNFEWFENEFMADKVHLMKYDIPSIDIDLMLDYIKMKI